MIVSQEQRVRLGGTAPNTAHTPSIQRVAITIYELVSQLRIDNCLIAVRRDMKWLVARVCRVQCVQNSHVDQNSRVDDRDS